MIPLLVPAQGGATRINCFAFPTRHNSSQIRALGFHGAPAVVFQRVAPQLRLAHCSSWHGRLAYNSSRHGRSVTCLFGGNGEPPEKKESDDSLWKSLQNSMGIFKKRSIDDILRDQIREKELGGVGDNDDPPIGGGGDGGDGGDGLGDTGGEVPDEGIDEIITEFFQVVLAILSVIVMYWWMLCDRQLVDRLVKDTIRHFVFGAKKSIRLTRLLEVLAEDSAEWISHAEIVMISIAPRWLRNAYLRQARTSGKGRSQHRPRRRRSSRRRLTIVHY